MTDTALWRDLLMLAFGFMAGWYWSVLVWSIDEKDEKRDEINER